MEDLLQHDLPPPSPPQPPPPPFPPPTSDPRITHARAIKSPFTDISIFNNLITRYSKSITTLFPYALRVFRHHLLPSPTVVSFTALISAHSHTFHSLRHFLSMLRHPLLPNHRTLASLFSTAATLSALPFGLSLHSLSLKLSLSHNPFVASSLLNFYLKCRFPCHASKLFDEIPHRDNVCFSAMIVGLAQNSRAVDALSLFSDMRCDGFVSTVHSVSGALCAAAELAALEQCRMVHGHAVVVGFDSNVVVGSALVDGYGKAGVVEDARRVFAENLQGMNIVGWNAMMAGYAQLGHYESTFELFDLMEGHGLVPDKSSFLAIFTALKNAGMCLQIDHWLTRMKEVYGLEPTLEHYTCLVDAMARAGQLERAERIALTMPFQSDAAVWRALLSACAFHGAADKARDMAMRLLELEPHDDSAYVIVTNVLSAAGRWDDVAELRKMMKDRRVKKRGGRSWIEVTERNRK
ncbi:hypothetical protein RIF29_26722 [Crotalaria pallida]|uniref:Pentatricopeptide repeat protein n=1 Tax=Crotalaria pallida TaxID=3830 RepID=A0AAN9EQA0_CROPI